MKQRNLLMGALVALIAIVAIIAWLAQQPLSPIHGVTAAERAQRAQEASAAANELENTTNEPRRSETSAAENATAPLNSAASPTGTFPIELVRKSNGSPVAGAEVLFLNRESDTELDDGPWIWMRL